MSTDDLVSQINKVLGQYESSSISQMLKEAQDGRGAAREQGRRLLADLDDATEHYRASTAKLDREIQATYTQRKEILAIQQSEMDADAKELRQLLDQTPVTALDDARAQVAALRHQVQEARLEQASASSLKRVMTPEEFETQLLLEVYGLFGVNPAAPKKSNMTRDQVWEAIAVQNGINRTEYESVFVRFPQLKMDLALSTAKSKEEGLGATVKDSA